MTVAELIECLEQFPAELPVYISHEVYEDLTPAPMLVPDPDDPDDPADAGREPAVLL